jgi:hypothetical protein
MFLQKARNEKNMPYMSFWSSMSLLVLRGRTQSFWYKHCPHRSNMYKLCTINMAAVLSDASVGNRFAFASAEYEYQSETLQQETSMHSTCVTVYLCDALLSKGKQNCLLVDCCGVHTLRTLGRSAQASKSPSWISAEAYTRGLD